MPKRSELLIFDWDGTLMDSAGAIIASIQASCRDLGLPVPERERAAHVIGLGLKDALAYAVPELPPSEYGRLAERYRHHYLARDPDIELFPGMREMLALLKDRGHVLALATGKSRVGLERVLEATQLKQYFDSSRCADETHSKPHPAMLQELMQELLFEPEATLMIGDTAHDLQMAVSAGVPALAVSYGAHPRASLMQFHPLACIDTPQELAPWLEKKRLTGIRATEAEASTRLICASSELAEGGDGVRFEVEWEGEAVPAFAIRHEGRVYAYLNRCAHIAMELDWKQGKFFDTDREYLICSTHGALYAPETGACRGGPCRGAKLVGLNVFEAGGSVYLHAKG